MSLPHNKLIVGIDQSSDVKQLLDLGIRQYYAGYLPPEWVARYATQVSLNRRYRLKEQFTDRARLNERIRTIKENGGQFFLALNAPYLNPELSPAAYALADHFAASDIDGIIVGSMTLLSHLRRAGYDKIVVSNLLGSYSAEAVGFFVDHFAPRKIILPRDLMLDEIDRIVSQHPGIDFEVFLFGDHCRLSEAHCLVEHGHDRVLRNDLCSYASLHRQYHRRANVNFKNILRDKGRSEAEKLGKLRAVSYHLPDILDALDVSLAEGRLSELVQGIQQFSRLDFGERLAENRPLLCRALNLFRRITLPQAESLVCELETLFAQPVSVPGDETFHKLNPCAVQGALARFAKHENIVSYKIPARGRDVFRLLNGSEATTPQPIYDYRASQYRL